jgi:hypothetical protein
MMIPIKQIRARPPLGGGIKKMLEVWLRYDLKTPEFGTPRREIIAAALEQVAWADDITRWSSGWTLWRPIKMPAPHWAKRRAG